MNIVHHTFFISALLEWSHVNNNCSDPAGSVVAGGRHLIYLGGFHLHPPGVGDHPLPYQDHTGSESSGVRLSNAECTKTAERLGGFCWSSRLLKIKPRREDAAIPQRIQFGQ